VAAIITGLLIERHAMTIWRVERLAAVV